MPLGCTAPHHQNRQHRGQLIITCKHVADRAVGELFYKPLKHVEGCRREVLLRADAAHERSDSFPVICVVSWRHALLAPMRPAISSLNLNDRTKDGNGNVADEFDAVN